MCFFRDKCNFLLFFYEFTSVITDCDSQGCGMWVLMERDFLDSMKIQRIFLEKAERLAAKIQIPDFYKNQGSCFLIEDSYLNGTQLFL
jgi:hypothetical protein